MPFPRIRLVREYAPGPTSPLRPKPVRIRRPEDPLTPEEIDPCERLQAQPHPDAETRS
ncbi:hypothetical protein [Streptomyces sp. NPDC093149]|uniref:hypothetical protein n=1 Tax=Streptomyces sp. NPDC093149 TaxID=3366031 RepID=UPI00382061E5